MSNRKTIDIVFDGQCGFCIRSLLLVRALDIRAALRFHDANLPKTMELFPELRDVDLGKAMYALVQGESPYRGFYAFRRLLWSSPLMWTLIALFYFPGASLIGELAYDWVARNRRNLGCGSDLCPLPVDGPEGDVRREE